MTIQKIGLLFLGKLLWFYTQGLGDISQKTIKAYSTSSGATWLSCAMWSHQTGICYFHEHFSLLYNVNLHNCVWETLVPPYYRVLLGQQHSKCQFSMLNQLQDYPQCKWTKQNFLKRRNSSGQKNTWKNTHHL
jgi:hypothetical protein